VLGAHLISSALILGGSVLFAAAVAPSVLRGAGSRDLAGRLNGQILNSLSVSAEVCFAILLATTWYLTRPARKSWPVVVVRRLPILGLIAAAVMDSILIPGLDNLRTRFPDWAGGPAAAAAHERFLRLHALSVFLLLVEIAAALALLLLVGRLAPQDSGTKG
jgi:hypothetical protein